MDGALHSRLPTPPASKAAFQAAAKVKVQFTWLSVLRQQHNQHPQHQHLLHRLHSNLLLQPPTHLLRSLHHPLTMAQP